MAAPWCEVEAEVDLKCVLVSASHTCGEECLPPRPGTCKCVCLCNGAAMKLRLMEQACGCSVMGGGGFKVRARLCFWHYGGECFQTGHGFHTLFCSAKVRWGFSTTAHSHRCAPATHLGVHQYCRAPCCYHDPGVQDEANDNSIVCNNHYNSWYHMVKVPCPS